MTGALTGLAVTVVGIYYAPDSTGIAPYTTDLCETLAAHGASVHAVVGVPHYPQWTVAPEYRSRVRLRYREERNGVRVSRVRHFVPASQNAARRGLYELSFRLSSGLACRGDRPDVVLGVTPNLAGAATAGALARASGAPLGLIVQDLMGMAAAQSGMPGGRRVSSAVAQLEARALRRAQRVGVITDAYVPLIVASGATAAIDHLPNYAHVRSSALSKDEARRALGWSSAQRIALHSGNMGLKQDLGNVIEAARLALGRRDDLTFVLLGDGNTRGALEAQARGLPNLRFLDPLPDDEYPVALAAADCLILNERPSVLNMSMPSKLTSYFAAGRPVVAATHEAGATAAEMARSGAGRTVPPGEPALLLRAVEELVDDPERSARLGQSGRDYATHHLSQSSARTEIVRFVAALRDGARPPERTDRHAAIVGVDIFGEDGSPEAAPSRGI
ncbi:MAG TPA: glycosyltransferase [Mycobacteriales bacterium]|nr:glycosyltransferase [Mycobacteriales bacterium]